MLHDDHGPVAVYGVPYLEPAVGLPTAMRRPGRHSARDARLARAAVPRAQPRGRPGRGDGAHPGRRRGPRRDPHRRAGARVGGGGRTTQERADAAQRQPSGSERDISVGGIGYVPASAVRRVQLRRARPPARPADPRASTCATAARRCPTRSPRSTTRRAAGWSRSASTARPAPSGSPRRSTGGSPCSAAASRTCSPSRRVRRPRGRLRSPSRSPTPPAPRRRWTGSASRFPHILTLEFKPEGVTADPRSYGERVKGRDDLTVAAEFVRHVRNDRATAAERELLAPRSPRPGHGRDTAATLAKEP